MITCLLIPILVGLICGVLGYLIGKMSGKDHEATIKSIETDLENYKLRNSQLVSDIETLRARNRSITPKTETQSIQKSNSITEPTLIPKNATFNAELAKAVFGKKIKENDLKVIEGIGPKIEQLFKTSGILTWKALSESSIDRLKGILSKAGERYQIHDPGTWARQSKLAYEGKWEELKKWQNELDGGREK